MLLSVTFTETIAATALIDVAAATDDQIETAVTDLHATGPEILDYAVTDRDIITVAPVAPAATDTHAHTRRHTAFRCANCGRLVLAENARPAYQYSYAHHPEDATIEPADDLIVCAAHPEPLSCHQAAAARDAQRRCATGKRRLTRAELYDLIPQLMILATTDEEFVDQLIAGQLITLAPEVPA